MLFVSSRWVGSRAVTMTVKVTIEFSANPNFGSTKDTGNKVQMLQEKIRGAGRGEEVKVVVKRVLERNKFEVTVGEQLVHCLARDGNIDGDKLARILDTVKTELERQKS